MFILTGFLFGAGLWFYRAMRLVGIYTVDQNERAVKTVFGRAQRVGGDKTTLDDPVSDRLRPDEKERYVYPQVRVIRRVVRISRCLGRKSTRSRSRPPP